MQAGQLRDVIDIQVPVEMLDTAGQADTSYDNLYSDVRANIAPLSGREYIAARQIHEEITTRIKTRFYPEVTANCRIVRTVEARNITTGDPIVTVEYYDVLAVLPDDVNGKEWLTMMCVQRISEGFRRGE